MFALFFFFFLLFFNPAFLQGDIFIQELNHPQLMAAFHELSHLRNVRQEPEDQGSPHLSFNMIQSTKTCAGPHPSIHLSGHGGTQCDWQTWAAVRPTLLLRGPCRSLECRANSILVVDKVKRAGAVPSVSIMGQRCCSAVVFLWYSKGDAVSYIISKQRVWLGGGGKRE